MLQPRKLIILLPGLLLLLALALPLALAAQVSTRQATPYIQAGYQDVVNGIVTLDRVATPHMSWVLIHAEANGRPGAVIGHAIVLEGETEGVDVEIDVAQATGTLYATLHRYVDGAGVAAFSSSSLPILDTAGNLVRTAFRVSHSLFFSQDQTGTVVPTDPPPPPPTEPPPPPPTEPPPPPPTEPPPPPTDAPTDQPPPAPTDAPTQAPTVGATQPPEQPTTGVQALVQVSAQDVADGSVTVDRIVATEPSWIVIHADANGQPGPILGQAAVPAGESTAVNVSIDAVQATPTLHAMLHRDLGQQGTFEFPGADVPTTDAAGNIVMVAFQATGGQATAAPTVAATAAATATAVGAGTATPGTLPVTGGPVVPWGLVLLGLGGLILIGGLGLGLARRS